MKVDLEIDGDSRFMLEVAGSALVDADTPGAWEDVLTNAIGALRYRAERMEKDADAADDSDHLHAPEQLRTWAADDRRAAQWIETLLDIGREEVDRTEGLSR